MAGVALAVLLENLTLTPVLCFQKKLGPIKYKVGEEGVFRNRSVKCNSKGAKT